MTDRPLFIGISANNVQADDALYLSNFNFAERRTIIWDPDTLVTELVNTCNVTTSGSPNYAQAQLAINYLNNRNKSLEKFLEHGGDLIVILRYLPTIRYKNVRGNLDKIDLNAETVLGYATPTSDTGISLTAAGPEATHACLGSMLKNLEYTALVAEDSILPLLKVPNSGDIAGGYFRTKLGGCVIFLPALINWREKSHEANVARNHFLFHALQLPNLLRKSDRISTDLPPWAIGYRLPAEQEARQRIDDHIKNIAEREGAIETERQFIAVIEPRKRLFTGTDTPFEEAVRDAFVALGINAILGPKHHCDVIGLYNDAILATEAKGLMRGAKPGNANQCLRWITDIRAALSQPPEDRDEIVRKYADILTELGVALPQSEDDEPSEMQVKGLVVINAHFDTSLIDRNNASEPAFNDQVKAIVTREKLCAVTGLQLLGMVLASEADESKKSRIAQSLFETVGVHAEFTDWHHFLHLPPSEATDEIDDAPLAENATD